MICLDKNLKKNNNLEEPKIVAQVTLKKVIQLIDQDLKQYSGHKLADTDTVCNSLLDIRTLCHDALFGSRTSPHSN